MIKRYPQRDGSVEEVVNTYADEFSGVINWMGYNEKHRVLRIVYRLSDVTWTHYNVPVEAYEMLKRATDLNIDEETAIVNDFKEQYPGEVL